MVINCLVFLSHQFSSRMPICLQGLVLLSYIYDSCQEWFQLERINKERKCQQRRGKRKIPLVTALHTRYPFCRLIEKGDFFWRREEQHGL